MRYTSAQPKEAAAVTQISDAELARQLSDRRDGALDELYARHAAALLRLAHHLLGSLDEAEDVVQDVFIGLPLAIRRYEERGAFAQWLKRLAARTALMHLRGRSRRSAESLGGDASRQLASKADNVDERIDLQTAIASLPDPLRVVFVLSHVEQLPHAEIAAILGIRRGTSEVRLYRAIRHLRGILENNS
jgi:RNA polymerase sigma-70 factor (ECF subfamily)